MARLARATGGADFDVEQADVQTWFHEIAGDLRSSYELAYYPSPGPSASVRTATLSTRSRSAPDSLD
jgi:hypothetical protein